MPHPTIRRSGNQRTARAPGLIALAIVLCAAAFVPAGVAGARSNVPAPDGEPCVPVAFDDNYSTPQDVQLVVSDPGVRANDTHCGNSVQLISTTVNGVLTLNPLGGFTYTPNAGYSGPDAFDYTFIIIQPPAFAGGDRPRGAVDTGHVDIIVAAPPCVPNAVPDAYETPYETTLNVGLPGVKVNDTHCDWFVHLFSNPANGSLTLNADGTFEYTPDAGFSGVDSFEYALAANMPGFRGTGRDTFGWRTPQGGPPSNITTVTITVTPPPPTTTSTTTTTTTTTTITTTTPATTTLPPPTTAVAPQTPTLPATR